MIADILGQGQETARTGRSICTLLQIKDIRDFTEQVARERKAGQPIAANSGRNPGYFLAANKKEMQQYCDSLQRRANEIEKTRKACLATMANLPGEQEA